MTDEDNDTSSEPSLGPKISYAPENQSVLPGFKKEISERPKDWRQWSDGQGNKIDSPKYGGRTSGAGKLIPPVTNPDGTPVRIGTFQVIRDARMRCLVVDFSKPIDDVEFPDADGVLHSNPIKGRTVYVASNETRAYNAMVTLHRIAEDLRAHREPDPLQCVDLAGKVVRLESFGMAQYKRGPKKNAYVLVDHDRHMADRNRNTSLKAENFKDAVGEFVRLARTLARDPTKKKKKKIFRGAPIDLGDTSSLGNFGFGGGSSFKPAWEKECPEPRGFTWNVCKEVFAKTGKWCRTANLIWADARPAALEEDARVAREAWLAEAGKEESVVEILRTGPNVKLTEKDASLLRSIEEAFDARFTVVKEA